MQIYDFDRDYKDVGVAKFTTKYFVVRNCLPNAKSDMLLSAWNAPAEWGKYATISVYFLLCMLHIYTVYCLCFHFYGLVPCWNDKGKAIVKFTSAYELVVAKTYFKKGDLAELLIRWG